MTAVGKYEDAHAWFELRPHLVQLVVDELTVEQHPRLVGVVGFIRRCIGHLAAVTGVGEEEEVAHFELRRGRRCRAAPRRGPASVRSTDW